ncbi:hypothetical protein SBA2_770011 [Acidobacteriia bacterium SbA2]|nr:hypothetical protein SBA2_770011 [Acidobacteriia bacterium SbA2]
MCLGCGWKIRETSGRPGASPLVSDSRLLGTRAFAIYACFAPWRETGPVANVEESRERAVFSRERT